MLAEAEEGKSGKDLGEQKKKELKGSSVLRALMNLFKGGKKDE